MTPRCKIWCAVTVTALASVSAAASWYVLRQRPEPVPTPPEIPTVRHASASQLFSSAANRLHREALAHFHADPKNGYARMPFVYEKMTKEWQTPWFSTGELDRDEPVPFAKDMERLHQATRQEFLAPPEPTAADASDALPEAVIWDPKKYDASKKVWEVKSIDLIGLLKDPTPVVYVSESVARQAEEDDMKTPIVRHLDELELAGLTALQKGEELFGRSRDGVIRLVGAVRAEESCLSCHRQKQEGDLLGAFSYTLREASYERQAWPGRKKGNPRPAVNAEP
jgi:hypothetical protein